MTERRHEFPFPCVDNNELRPGMSDSEVHVLASDDLEKGSAVMTSNKARCFPVYVRTLFLSKGRNNRLEVSITRI